MLQCNECNSHDEGLGYLRRMMIHFPIWPCDCKNPISLPHLRAACTCPGRHYTLPLPAQHCTVCDRGFYFALPVMLERWYTVSFIGALYMMCAMFDTMPREVTLAMLLLVDIARAMSIVSHVMMFCDTLAMDAGLRSPRRDAEITNFWHGFIELRNFMAKYQWIVWVILYGMTAAYEHRLWFICVCGASIVPDVVVLCFTMAVHYWQRPLHRVNIAAGPPPYDASHKDS